VKDDAPGRALESPLDQAWRETDAVALGNQGARAAREVDRFGLEEADSRPFQDFEARGVQGRALGGRDPGKRGSDLTASQTFLCHPNAVSSRARSRA